MVSLFFQIRTPVSLVWGYPLVINPFHTRNNYYFPVCFSFCVLRTWLGFLPVGAHKSLLTCTGSSTIRFGPRRIWPDRNVGCTPFMASVLLTVASSQGTCPSLFFFWLSLQVGLDHGRTISFHHLWGSFMCPQLSHKRLIDFGWK